jgi:hypothetical protein
MAKVQALTAFNDGVHGMAELEDVCADAARAKVTEWMKENAEVADKAFKAIAKGPEIS